MSLHLLNEVEDLFTPELIGRTAVSLGESERVTGRTVSGLLPLVLSVLAWKAGAGKVDAERLLEVANLSVQGDGFGEDGLRLFDELFGARKEEIARDLSSFAGLDESSADALVRLAYSSSLAVIGKYATENKLTPDGLAGLLFTQQREFENGIPLGLAALYELLVPAGGGGSGLRGRGSQSTAPGAGRSDRGGDPRKIRHEKEPWSLRWLFPLLIILLA